MSNFERNPIDNKSNSNEQINQKVNFLKVIIFSCSKMIIKILFNRVLN